MRRTLQIQPTGDKHLSPTPLICPHLAQLMPLARHNYFLPSPATTKPAVAVHLGHAERAPHRDTPTEYRHVSKHLLVKRYING